MKKQFLIAPSILAANLADLANDVQNVIDAGADLIHFDVMDQHFVPNLSFGLPIFQALKKSLPNLVIDVHLMAYNLDELIPQFAKAGADFISIHPEATAHLDRYLQLIKDLGCKAGLAINPATSLNCLDFVLDKLDLILIMGVNPGFGGQKFIVNSLEKISQVRKLIDSKNLDIRIEVDGGVKVENIREIAKAGADMFVAGTAIFGEPDYKKIIQEMRKNLQDL